MKYSRLTIMGICIITFFTTSYSGRSGSPEKYENESDKYLAGKKDRRKKFAREALRKDKERKQQYCHNQKIQWTKDLQREKKKIVVSRILHQ